MSAEVDSFLAGHRVEAHGVEALKKLPLPLQVMVAAQGSMEFARDQTAVLLGRVKKVKVGLVSGGMMVEPWEQRAGDWKCPNCNDLQFAKNQICRKCGTPDPTRTMLASGADVWLSRHALEPRVIEQFRLLAPAQQQFVMSRGTLDGARDPNAVLIGRIATAKRGGT